MNLVLKILQFFSEKYWVVEDFESTLKVVLDKKNPKRFSSSHHVYLTISGPFYTEEDAARSLQFWMNFRNGKKYASNSNFN